VLQLSVSAAIAEPLRRFNGAASSSLEVGDL
jgi:hypothetical protein